MFDFFFFENYYEIEYKLISVQMLTRKYKYLPAKEIQEILKLHFLCTMNNFSIRIASKWPKFI